MESEKTAEQYALQENKRICAHLDYPEIVSHLIQRGVISQQEHIHIQDEFADNARRLQEIVSMLIKLNSKASFDAFRTAVNQLGETVLAQKLILDYNSFGIPLNTGDAHPCLFNIDVLNMIFIYLGQPDLISARLVCQKWNAVITSSHANKLTAIFLPCTEKFLEVGRKLKVLRLHFLSTWRTPVDRFPNADAILPKLSTPENLVLRGITNLDDYRLRLLAFPNGEGQLKLVGVKLDNVSPGAFQDFIASHRHTLRWIHITICSCANPLGLMMIPRLENLKYLKLYGDSRGGMFGDSVSSLEFCTSAPKLKCLRIHRVGSQVSSQPAPQPTFAHEGLKELRLDFDYDNSTADGIREFLSHVPQYFPNLMRLEALARNEAWPVQLQHLQLQPTGFSNDEMTVSVWTSTSTYVDLS